MVEVHWCVLLGMALAPVAVAARFAARMAAPAPGRYDLGDEMVASAWSVAYRALSVTGIAAMALGSVAMLR